MNTSCDEYVIETTPVKKNPKKIVFRAKSSKLEPKEIEDKNKTETGVREFHMLTQLVDECYKHISEELLEGINRISLEDNKREPSAPAKNPKCTTPSYGLVDILVEPIETTRSRNCYKLYVFYLIEELSKFTPSYYPKNNKIQVVGVTQYSEDSSCCFLCSLEDSNDETATIKLNNAQLRTVPTTGEEVVMFCDLVFEEDLPIIVGNFFQKFTLLFSSYKELMLKLRSTVPLENFKMVSIPEATMDKNNDSEDLRMNLFMKYNQGHIGVSRSMLNAFLNDSSFKDV